jgi:hypothetical protein
MRAILIVSLAVLAALPTASSAKRERLSDEERLTKALEGLTPGKPQSCISLREAQQTDAYGNDVLFTVGRRLVYRSSSKGCEKRHGEVFITRTYGTQLCRGDVLERADLMTGMQSGFCIAGNFTPYTRMK